MNRTGRLLAGLWSLAAGLAAGCSGTVAPPAWPAHPTVVYLCDYGYHSSLLLPVGDDGTWVEYLYGDWNWAALNHTGVWPAVQAGLFSPAATLGRRYVYQPGRMPRPITLPEKQLAVVVGGKACRDLEQALDARWRAAAGTAVYSGPPGMYYWFVKDGQRYGLLHNCNRVTADWLDDLGCRTGGVALLSHFRVDPAPRPADGG